MEATEVNVERIDHLGIIAGVIQDLKIIERIDSYIPSDPREEVTTGEAVAAMIINGLGFSDRPLTLTPQFFENKALSKLLREGIKAEHFNRFKLGRALDDCHAYGCDVLFSQLSMSICQQEGIDTRFNALDTTTFSLTGEYDVDCDEHTIHITQGYSKDHRPDLKQAILELVCAHDGGVPVISKSWDGNASDTKIFRKRAQALISSFKAAEVLRYLVADSKLYDRETVESYLKEVPFITRIPGTIKQEQETINQALQTPLDEWAEVDEKNRYMSFKITHYGLLQRWIVVWSKEAQERATKTAEKKCKKEKEELEKRLKKLEKQEYACLEDAKRALKESVKAARFCQLVEEEIEEKKKYSGKGRPCLDKPYQVIYQIKGKIEINEEKKSQAIQESSCFIIGTSIPDQELNSLEVIEAYKNQNKSVERGFRFLKDPLMFASSLFVKKPSRVMGLLMVMTLALLVYAVAQRRLRQTLKKLGESLPNQIRQETQTPTLRWIFQLLGGIEVIRLTIRELKQVMITGVTDLRKRILTYFGDTVRKIYEIKNEPALP